MTSKTIETISGEKHYADIWRDYEEHDRIVVGFYEIGTEEQVDVSKEFYHDQFDLAVDYAEMVVKQLDDGVAEPNEEVFFLITRLHRDDIKQLYIDKGMLTPKLEKQIESIPDEIMMKIAQKMADDYLEQLFWGSLEIIGEEYAELEVD